MKTHPFAIAALFALASPSICFAGNGADQGAGGGQAKPEADAAPEITPEAVKEDVTPDVPGVARMSHPDGATSCSHDGHEYAADKKGVFNVPVRAVDDLKSHGFVLLNG